MKRRRICIVLPSLLPWGGVERVQAALTSQYLAAGFDVDVLFCEEPADVTDALPQGARVIKFSAPRMRQFIVPFTRYLAATKPDVVHAAMWPLTVCASVAHRMVGASALLTLSDHNTLSLQYKGWGGIHRLMLRTSIRATYPWAAARVAVSSGVADDLSALSGINRDKFTVIHNPMSIPDTIEISLQAAEAAWDGWNGPRIITAGQFKRQKNHQLLLVAFKRLLANLDARLMLLGTGELEDEVKGVARALGVSGKVIFAGQVENPLAYYKTADMFVLSSDYEGFGNVIVEALACGTPVVSTDRRSGPADILERGRYGTLVPTGDADAMAGAMLQTLQAPPDPESLKRRAQEFSALNVSRQYLKLFFPNLMTR